MALFFIRKFLTAFTLCKTFSYRSIYFWCNAWNYTFMCCLFLCCELSQGVHTDGGNLQQPQCEGHKAECRAVGVITVFTPVMWHNGNASNGTSVVKLWFDVGYTQN